MKESVSRRGFLSALLAAGAGAALTGCSPRSIEEEKGKTKLDGGSFDIVVIGAGGAGMSATINAVEKGAKVLLLEKMPVAGGNTCFAEGGMNACCTKTQKENGIEDSVDLMVSDTYIGGHEIGDLDLIRHMCSNSNAAVEWLAERGIVLNKLSTSGGASVKRIHRPMTGEAVGRYIVKGMSEKCRELGVSAVCNTKVKEIIMKDGKVAGVLASNPQDLDIEYKCKAVIIASGGFGANHEMLAQYRPELLDAVTTNQPGAQGDGILFGQAAGADTVDVGEIQVHPTVEQTTATLLSEGIRGDGAILINANGVRFGNELRTRDVVSFSEWDQPGKFAWAVFDHTVYEHNTSIEEKFVTRKIIQVADDLETLGKKMEVPVDAFVESVKSYNGNIDKGVEDPHGRTKSLYPLVKAPYYAVKVAPGIHHTMGGLRVNTNMEVLDKAGTAIPGMFAAGEVTGGTHGGNRLGGNAVCDINVNGLTASNSALAYLGK